MKRKRPKTFAEKLYHVNVLPDGNLNSVDYIDVVMKKLEDPPLDGERDTEKGPD